MRQNNSMSQWLLFIIFIIFVGWMFISHFLIPEPILRAPIVTSHQPSTSATWTRQNIYINPSGQTPLIATQSKLMFIGSTSSSDLPRLIALDGNTGNPIWQYGNNNETTLTASNKMIFVGEVGSVTALNLDDGVVVWSTSLPSRSVLKLLLRDNILYIDTVGGSFFLLDAETGKIIQSISYTINGAPNKDIPDWSDHKMDLAFVGDIAYFQKQTGYPDYKGEIIAMKELSGNRIWGSGDLFAASRNAASPLGIFVLGLDGKLLKFNPTEGFKEEIIQFIPSPVLRDDKEGWNYGYYVAVDTDTQSLFVYMGDSTQLFAFQLPILP
jgi:outer membrane protein assembly factor BamB